MKHFGEARRDAAGAIAQVQGCDGICLIWDLRGELRVLVRLAVGADEATAVSAVKSAMSLAADGFWSGTVWVWPRERRSSKAERLVFETAWSQARVLVGGAPEIRELDRHFSKESWFGAPLFPPWPALPETPPILSFYSFKGGVGRTTALAAFAIQLARAGKRVCVVDLDLEAPGIGTILTSAAGEAQYGVLDFLLEAGLGQQPEIGDYLHFCDDERVVGSGPPIAVVPAGRLDDDYLEKLARVDFRNLLEPSKGETEGGLSSLMRILKRERQADYVLIDSRSGLHDIGGLALNGLAHLDVVFGVASEQSWQGLRLLISHLGRRRIERGLQHQLFALVYAMAPPASSLDRTREVERFRDRAHHLVSESFYTEEPDAGWPSPPPAEAWPVPAIEDASAPHYAIPLGFNADLQRYASIDTIANVLTEGDYFAFGSALIERLGRTAP